MKARGSEISSNSHRESFKLSILEFVALKTDFSGGKIEEIPETEGKADPGVVIEIVVDPGVESGGVSSMSMRSRSRAKGLE